MKKIFLVLTLALSVFYTEAQMNKVAVVGISANNEISTVGFDDLTLNQIQGIFTSTEFNIDEELARFKEYLLNDLSKEFPFEIIDEASVINNKSYIAFKDAYQDKLFVKLAKRSPAEGYASLQGFTKSQLDSLSDMFESANAFMVVRLDYNIGAKTMINGNGKAGAQASVDIELWLPSMKRIMRLSAKGMSDVGFTVVAQQITSNRDKIPQALKEASDELFVEMKENLPKRIKKMNKKLAKLEE